jgi:hypothetical protein
MANIKAGFLIRSLAAGAVVSAVATGSGCASGAVQRGALIGAASGAVLGVGTGLLVSDKDLLGSPATKESGNLSLATGEAVGASVAIGVVFGALVGAMVGHASDDEPSSGSPEAAPPASAHSEPRVRADAQVSRAAPSAF